MCAANPPPGAVGSSTFEWWSPELTAALRIELRSLRLALAAEVEAGKELDRRLNAATAERDRLLAALELTDELRDALIAAGLGSLTLEQVRAFLAAIAARGGLPSAAVPPLP